MTARTFCSTCLFILVVMPAAFGGDESLSVEHSIVAIEDDRFHGWPANNGVWQWGDEILVGFTQGDFFLRQGHNINGRQDSLLARSLDGGRTWTMFDPDGFLDDDNRQYLGHGKTSLKQPLDFSGQGFALRIFATGYHGNDDPEGGFFYSSTRGENWHGPHRLTGLLDDPELQGIKLSPRTDYLIQDSSHCFIFVSAHRDTDRLKRIGCIQTPDGGQSFEFVSWVTPETDEASAIMSQTVQLSPTEFVLAYRKMWRSSERPDEIEVCRSTDGCQTWSTVGTLKVMKTHSNPPALLALRDGRLCCAYGDRHVGEIRARFSEDRGTSWGPELIIRDDFQAMAQDTDTQSGLNADIGYPRLVQRSDGRLVVIYYWATADHPQQFIGASIWKP